MVGLYISATRAILGAASLRRPSHLPPRELVVSEAGEVAARMRQTRDETLSNRISNSHEHNRNGLRFAPATQGDEGAYTATHSALAAYDVAVNTQLAAAAPGPKE